MRGSVFLDTNILVYAEDHAAGQDYDGDRVENPLPA